MAPKVSCICGQMMYPPQMTAHLGGKPHRERMAASAAAAPTGGTAPVSRGLQQQAAQARGQTAPQHALGARIQPSGQAHGRSTPASQNAGGGDMFCERCEVAVYPQFWTTHLQSASHLRRTQQARQQAEFAAATANKNGIEVSADVDFGVVELGASEAFTASFSLTQTNPAGRVLLLRTPFTSDFRGGGQGFSAQLLSKSPWIFFRKRRSIAVTFRPTHAGRVEDTLEFQLLDVATKTRFVILRRVQAVVGSPADHEALKPQAPYVRPPVRPRQPRGRVVGLPRPPTWTESVWVVRLAEYKIPEALIEAAAGRKARDEVRREFMPNVFNLSTYARHFQTLLWAEEDQQAQDLDQYTMESVEIRPDHPRYKVDVPGLAEKRPSVLVGDYIQIRRPGASSEPWYEGIVHAIQEASATLRFPDAFSTYRGSRFDVRFVLNRLPMRRMHQAVTMRSLQDRVLFPDAHHVYPRQCPTKLEMDNIVLFKRILENNVEQMETVAAILHRRPGSVPFILFGPPGTGKTTTLVEAMRQLLNKDEDVKIFACAPSNSAADLIAQRLLDLGPSQLFRFNSFSREYKHLPGDLQPFSLFNGNHVFAMPAVEDLKGYRVVVSTCIAGGAAYGLGVPPGHFTHIFVDEAGQATEPEATITINTLAGPLTNIVVAGDPKQLGPLLRSPIARDLGMRTSYLDRLMERPIYDLDHFRGLNVVKLVKNWRSHASILRFANERFYAGELVACGDPVVTDSLLRSSVLAKPRFPVVFHAVSGKDQREKSSPSFFNADEATIVKHYCTDLIGDRSARLKTSDIGVISPYRAQCGKILQLFSRDQKLQGIKVASVEEFQGQERRVIIMSTVRSNTDFITHDIKHALGFVANPRRFNVAITRAQALLVVVGDPVILSLDPIWRAFLGFVHQAGGWKGKKPDWDTAAPVDAGRGYDVERRAQVDAETEDMLARIRSMIVSANEEAYLEIPELGADDVHDEDAEDAAWRDDFQ